MCRLILKALMSRFFIWFIEPDAYAMYVLLIEFSRFMFVFTLGRYLEEISS